MTKPKVRIILDSGAFSAWKRGIQIDLKDYIAYVKKNEHLLQAYVNLDVIPGSPDRQATQAEIESAAASSYKNLQSMKKAGLDPMPVFHFGEDFKWLERLLFDQEPYIGIGGLANASGTPQQIAWLDRVFTRLTDLEGRPIVRTHGFGVASFDLLKRYPWYTCDATSWALTAAYGGIYVPVYQNGIPDYTFPPVKLTVSEVDRKAGKMPPDHYLRYGPLMKRRVMDILEHEVGVRVEDAVKDYETRARAIVFFMRRFETAIGEQPFRHRIRGLI